MYELFFVTEHCRVLRWKIMNHFVQFSSKIQSQWLCHSFVRCRIITLFCCYSTVICNSFRKHIQVMCSCWLGRQIRKHFCVILECSLFNLEDLLLVEPLILIGTWQILNSGCCHKWGEMSMIICYYMTNTVKLQD